MNDLLKTSKPEEEHRSYEGAVRSLNQLQSNAAVLEKIRVERDARRNENIPKMMVFLQRVGIQLDDVNKLKVIHITGTKGKGSTGAFCESILRAHGYKTGFFSSPHLIEVRERIRINGKPISFDAFSNYYWQCYELLRGSDGNAADMPAYFAFLTAMAFKVFVEEEVDVAIVEVGIGGRYDSTNFVSKPVACGVTSLGLDHVSILGDTVEKIAWQKGGIFKAGAAAITVADQPGDTTEVLRQCAAEVGVRLQIAPPLDQQLCESAPSLSLEGKVQQTNAALAVQLSQSWLHSVEVPLSPMFLKVGLQTCRWPGRNQVIMSGMTTYYLDGAHTVESIRQCVEWFDERSAADLLLMKETCVRVLLFNLTGDRNVAALLEPLLSIGFDAVIFCPNLVSETGNSDDQTSLRNTPNMQLRKSEEIRELWVTLNARHRQAEDVSNQALLFPCIENALHWITSARRNRAGGDGACSSTVSSSLPSRLASANHVQVLVTGSLHLVGGVLAALNYQVD